MEKFETTVKQIKAIQKHFDGAQVDTPSLHHFLAGYDYGHSDAEESTLEESTTKWSDMLCEAITAYVRDHEPENIDDPFLAQQLRIIWIAANNTAKDQTIEQVKKYVKAIRETSVKDKPYPTQNHLDALLLKFHDDAYHQGMNDGGLAMDETICHNIKIIASGELELAQQVDPGTNLHDALAKLIDATTEKALNEEHELMLKRAQQWNLANHDSTEMLDERLHEIWEAGVEEGSDIDIDEYKEFKVEFGKKAKQPIHEKKSFEWVLRNVELDGQQDTIDLWTLEPGEDMKVTNALITRTK